MLCSQDSVDAEIVLAQYHPRLTQTIAEKSDFLVGAIHVALADRRVLPLERVVLRKSYRLEILIAQ